MPGLPCACAASSAGAAAGAVKRRWRGVLQRRPRESVSGARFLWGRGHAREAVTMPRPDSHGRPCIAMSPGVFAMTSSPMPDSGRLHYCAHTTATSPSSQSATDPEIGCNTRRTRTLRKTGSASSGNGVDWPTARRVLGARRRPETLASRPQTKLTGAPMEPDACPDFGLQAMLAVTVTPLAHGHAGG